MTLSLSPFHKTPRDRIFPKKFQNLFTLQRSPLMRNDSKSLTSANFFRGHFLNQTTRSKLRQEQTKEEEQLTESKSAEIIELKSAMNSVRNPPPSSPLKTIEAPLTSESHFRNYLRKMSSNYRFGKSERNSINQSKPTHPPLKTDFIRTRKPTRELPKFLDAQKLMPSLPPDTIARKPLFRRAKLEKNKFTASFKNCKESLTSRFMKMNPPIEFYLQNNDSPYRDLKTEPDSKREKHFPRINKPSPLIKGLVVQNSPHLRPYGKIIRGTREIEVSPKKQAELSMKLFKHIKERVSGIPPLNSQIFNFLKPKVSTRQADRQ